MWLILFVGCFVWVLSGALLYRKKTWILFGWCNFEQCFEGFAVVSCVCCLFVGRFCLSKRPFEHFCPEGF